MKLLTIASMIVLGLVGCGESVDVDQVRTEAREGTVDECYEEQADAYRNAAEFAQSTIQSYVPEMIDASASMIEAGSRQDVNALSQGYRSFQSAADSMQAEGGTFQEQLEAAESLCD